jgi:hypothetical protein
MSVMQQGTKLLFEGVHVANVDETTRKVKLLGAPVQKIYQGVTAWCRERNFQIETDPKPFDRFLKACPEFPSSEATAHDMLLAWINSNAKGIISFDTLCAGWAAIRGDVFRTLNAATAEEFLKRNPGFKGRYNGEMLASFLSLQLGDDDRVLWPPESFEAAYAYLKSNGKLAEDRSEPTPTPSTPPGPTIEEMIAQRAAEEAAARKLSPIGKPVSKKLRQAAVLDRRSRIQDIEVFDRSGGPVISY